MKRTRSHWLMALLLGSTLVAATAASAADPSNVGPAPRHAAMGSHLQQQLGLTDEQMQAIHEVHARHAASSKQLWQSVRQAQSELRQLALNGGDQDAIQAKTAAVAQLLSQSLQMRVASLQEISPILTPEQRAKFAQMGPGSFRHRGGHQPQAQPQGS
jgi:Spy/CpxP family protein refolding chaperone